jgi:GNAT superfamily N-acetyltransferase
MTSNFSLPPGFIIRPIKSSDKWKILQMFLNWNFTSFPINIVWSLLILLLILTLIIIPPLFIALLLFLVFQYYFIYIDWSNVWIVENRYTTIGFAEITNYETHSILKYLFIQKEYRRQKIGSYLVVFLIQTAKKPIYLNCYKKLVPFYKNLGFSIIDPQEISPTIRMQLTISQVMGIVTMVLL